ncbi:arabinogalactan O-methyltransferase 2 [Musa acuminata AAA Group]|uniref:arabinogalactan O-methyltransferase 2 n=1 Tax=Musa acuminata AAA Group TaxID=214697 RepID=UPI0031E415DA
MWPKKLIFIFLLLLSSLSIVRLFKLLWTSSIPAIPEHLPPHAPEKPRHDVDRPREDILGPKEHQLVSNIIARRIPCNLLIFGYKPQFLGLATLNSQGTTVFLEDDPEKLRSGRSKGLRMYPFGNHEKARRAYELLQHARRRPACRPGAGTLRAPRCELALRGLPEVLYESGWDVVVIDGPSGDGPEAPGRMGAIYTAAVMARAGRSTDVLVHDTDRTIEKWYSWEFLCHENLASSKGKLWHFRIEGNSSSDRFCETAASPTL